MRIFGFEVREAGPPAPVLKLARRAAPPLAAVAPRGGGWSTRVREPFTGAWQRNQEWTVDSVLAHHAVFACITRISQDIGKLRPKLVEQGADGIWKETTSPAFSPVLQRPNRYQNHIQFKEWWATSKLTHGNVYALKERDARGVVVALYLLDPSRVTVLATPSGQIFYQLGDDNLSGVKSGAPAAPASEIIHDRINCLFHPLVGVSPIFACGMAANMGLEIERNSAAFFGNGSTPSGILTSTVDLNPTKAEELSQLWNSQFGGDNSGRVAVLAGGMKFEPMGMTAVDSQLIEQLNWSAETVCSAFHVPGHKVGIGPQPTFSNGEQRNQDYYSDCLQAHIEAWELCMDDGLGLTARKEGKLLGVELDLDGLLRMDQASQVKTLTEGVKGSVYTPNEARRKVDLPPLPGGNTVYMQQQNYSLEALDARDRENPLAPSTQPPPAPPTQPAQEPAVEDEDDGGEEKARASLALEIEMLTLTLETAS